MKTPKKKLTRAERMQGTLGLVLIVAGVGLFLPSSWMDVVCGLILVFVVFVGLPDVVKPTKDGEWKPPSYTDHDRATNDRP